MNLGVRCIAVVVGLVTGVSKGFFSREEGRSPTGPNKERTVGRAAWIPLTWIVLAGCGFGVPLKQSTQVPQQAEGSAKIRLGESTRAEVRAALGEPLLQSGFWRVEVYRADDKRTELGFMVAIVVPVPVGVFSAKTHGYVLVTYDAAGRVSQVSPGTVSEGSLASDSGKWMAIRADDLTFAVDPVRTKLRSTLLADSSRLSGYLSERRQSNDCTLVAACDDSHGCLDRIAIDDGEPLDLSPVTVLCAPDAPCPKGSRLDNLTIDGKSFFQVPVLHAVSAAPGPHLLRVTSSVLKGGGEATFDCAGGEALYGIVHSRVEGASFWSKGTLQSTVTFSTAAPEAWGGYSAVLYRDGRWLVSRD